MDQYMQGVMKSMPTFADSESYERIALALAVACYRLPVYTVVIFPITPGLVGCGGTDMNRHHTADISLSHNVSKEVERFVSRGEDRF